MPAGRPSEYDPAICEVLGALGHEGEGMAEAIVACGISRDTFYRWQEKYPEFSDAVKGMRARSQAWWERKGREATFGGVDGFNATSFIFNMKNRFPDEWRDKQEVGLDANVRVSGVEMTFVGVDPKTANR